MSDHAERMARHQRTVELAAIRVVARFEALAAEPDADALELYGDTIDDFHLALIDLEYERVIHG